MRRASSARRTAPGRASSPSNTPNRPTRTISARSLRESLHTRNQGPPERAYPVQMLSAEAESVLRTVEERNIRFVRLWFTDVLGFLKAFTITSQELEGDLRDGMGFDGSSIEGFSRIQESDMVARPDASTFQIIPWKTEQPAAR